jgi:hypothetical protein
MEGTHVISTTLTQSCSHSPMLTHSLTLSNQYLSSVVFIPITFVIDSSMAAVPGPGPGGPWPAGYAAIQATPNLCGATGVPLPLRNDFNNLAVACCGGVWGNGPTCVHHSWNGGLSDTQRIAYAYHHIRGQHGGGLIDTREVIFVFFHTPMGPGWHPQRVLARHMDFIAVQPNVEFVAKVCPRGGNYPPGQQYPAGVIQVTRAFFNASH